MIIFLIKQVNKTSNNHFYHQVKQETIHSKILTQSMKTSKKKTRLKMKINHIYQISSNQAFHNLTLLSKFLLPNKFIPANTYQLLRAIIYHPYYHLLIYKEEFKTKISLSIFLNN